MKPLATRPTALILVLLLATAVAGQAQDAPSFWQQLKNKLDGITPQKRSTTTTAVGGVRGAKDQAGDTLYWKGEEAPLVVAEEELADFNQASLAAMNGETATALARFQQFLRAYPQSALRPDAVAAIAQLQTQMDAAAPAAVPAPPAATEPPAAPAAAEPTTAATR